MQAAVVLQTVVIYERCYELKLICSVKINTCAENWLAWHCYNATLLVKFCRHFIVVINSSN